MAFNFGRNFVEKNIRLAESVGLAKSLEIHDFVMFFITFLQMIFTKSIPQLFHTAHLFCTICSNKLHDFGCSRRKKYTNF